MEEQKNISSLPQDGEIVTHFSCARAALDKIDFLFDGIGSGSIDYENLSSADKAIVDNSMVYLAAMLKVDDEYWAKDLGEALVLLCKNNGGI